MCSAHSACASFLKLALLVNEIVERGFYLQPASAPHTSKAANAAFGVWRAAIDAVRTLPEQRAAVIEFPKHRKIFIDGFVFVPAVVA
jgi:hypothetical protein